MVIGILATVLGALGVLGGLLGGIIGAAIFASGQSALYMVLNGLALVVAAVQGGCGVMILINRGKSAPAA